MPRKHKVVETAGTLRRPDARLSPEEMDVLYARVFGGGEGQIVLAELERVFASSAVTSGGIDAIIQTYHRAGQRHVVEYIVHRMNRAAGVPEE